MRIACCVLLFCLAAGVAQAAPVCAPGSLASYELLAPGPTGGCTVGPLGFHDFGFVVQSMAGGPTPVSASNITVTPMMDPFRFGLMYSSNGFSVGSGQFIQYLLTYTIDPPPPIIHGFDVSFDPGVVTISSLECLDAPFSGAVCPNSTVTQTVSDPGPHDSTVNFPGGPYTTLGDRTTITLDGTMGATSFASLTETAITPEPATAGIVGFLILGLAAWRRTRAGR